MIRTVMILAVPVLVVGCLPTTPAEAGVGVLFVGVGCVLWGLGISSELYKVEGKKPVALFVLGAGLLLGGGLIALGQMGRLVGPVSPGVVTRTRRTG
jgi:hypothetical protein